MVKLVQNLNHIVTAKGIVALNFWDNGFKQLSSNKKPLSILQMQKVKNLELCLQKYLKHNFMQLVQIHK